MPPSHTHARKPTGRRDTMMDKAVAQDKLYQAAMSGCDEPGKWQWYFFLIQILLIMPHFIRTMTS